eukprot:TRINITY_DN3416_c0_g1_i1.p1 TRINITY_DN3416_c0_g1~~TRINITY_DN3416_c0_g1_i1.p1  ORF type:complete len:581 (+),score=172.30 TRINITY_DN3416_c0_g1_i1:49-1791(+)
MYRARRCGSILKATKPRGTKRGNYSTSFSSSSISTTRSIRQRRYISTSYFKFDADKGDKSGESTYDSNVIVDSAATNETQDSVSNFNNTEISTDNTNNASSGANSPTKPGISNVAVDPPAPPTMGRLFSEDDIIALLPKEIVSELDKHIIGQPEAKKAVAVALRNRWRRKNLPKEQADEIIPKNILMIGPTGCGKTEIARRIAKLSQAPFIKVEATKFTEVGFHGKDVDQIIKDLLEVAINDVTQKEKTKGRDKIKEEVEEKLLDMILGESQQPQQKENFRALLRAGELENQVIDVKFPSRKPGGGGGSQGTFGNVEIVLDWSKIMEALSIGGNGGTLGGGNNNNNPGQGKKRMTIAECRPILEEMCSEQKISKEETLKRAIANVENNGIVFIDEIDKIVVRQNSYRSGADASSEGVQRDLLPLIEGTVVNTKHGNVDTTKILFICSGAFHDSKPADMLAELQGRLPIKVQLKPLTKDDMYRILTETKFNQLDQAEALLRTEGVQLKFTEGAIKTIAELTFKINETVENIGARRLYTVLERILENISFECSPGDYIVGEEEVKKNLSEMLIKSDLSRYVL